MHATWELMGCTDTKNNCDEKNLQAESMKCNSMLSKQNSKLYDTTTTTTTVLSLDNSGIYVSTVDYQNSQCMLCLSYIFSFSFTMKT